jgi:2'-hydroxyisoflavone reductase
MHILVLGGTSFVGRAVVAEALSRGHAVTVFNRGSHPTPHGAAQLIGDRLEPDGHAALKGQTFDAVLDTWQLDPVAVERALAVLKGNVGHYGYISSISVYDMDQLADGSRVDEASPTVDPKQPGLHEYMACKRGSELAALDAGIPLLIARAGLILGPHEVPTNRLPWWLWRLKKGGKTLAPGPMELGLQYIDVDDLAGFMVSGAESKLEGIFNTISEPGHTTMGELLTTANVATGGLAQLVWKTPEEILAAGIRPWTELPIWLAPGKETDAMLNIDTTKAHGAGLRVRSVGVTIRNTWDWLVSGEDVPPPDSIKVGLDPKKEAALLDDIATNE